MADNPAPPELNWKDFLSEHLHQVPLHALQTSTLRRLGLYLDQELDAIDPHADYMPDFTGLADLIGFDSLEIQSFERVHEKGKLVLQEWMKRSHLDPAPTAGKLLEFIALMGREDILTSLCEKIAKDCQRFLENKEKLRPVQVGEVSPGPGEPEEPELITVSEVWTGRKILYDAFVCYNPATDGSEDMKFVHELITRFESPPYNFKLFVPHRDDLAGLQTHSINARIISERCRHMIVVLSKNFLDSKACDFQTSFAHSLSPGARSKRMVPVKLEQVTVPHIMKIMALCDFTKRDLRDWAWVRLAQSIKVALKPDDFEIQQPNPANAAPMEPLESLWSRRPPVPQGNVAMGETSPGSPMDSGRGSLPTDTPMAIGELPCEMHKSHTAPVANCAAPAAGSTESLKASSFSEVVGCDDRKSSSNPNLTGDGSTCRVKKEKSKSARALAKLTKTFTRKKTEEDMETGL